MLIGLARGFLKELGVTLVLMFLLFFMNQFRGPLESGMVRAFEMTQRYLPVSNQDRLSCWLYIFIIVGATFVSYQGETLAFAGQPLRGPQGAALGLLTGLLNGYLVAGSIWYYMAYYNYPCAWLGFSAERLSDLAKAIVGFLPLTFLGEPVLFGQSLLLYLSALLLLARVIR
jgi:hypothetical protein